MLETVKGIVETKIFYNEQNHYGIFLISSENDHDMPLTIVGNFYQIELKTRYEFIGQYVENARYGMQFKVESYIKINHENKKHIINYLSGPSFKGIGIKSATALVEKYGEDILNLIQENPQMILEIKGVSKANLENLKNNVLQEDPRDKFISTLSVLGLGGKTIGSILNYYKDDAEYLVTENPYRIVDEVHGVGFEVADTIGRSLEFGETHPYRIEALMSETYKKVCFDASHSFISKEVLMERLSSFHPELLETAYTSLLKKGILIQEDTRLYHYTQYDSEVEVANFLNRFSQSKSDLLTDQFDDQVKLVEEKLNIEFGETQKDAIETFLKESVVILTGGPGTGKSTLLSGIVSYLQLTYPAFHITLCAPTGRAAKRLKELTNVSASTIHSILKWSIESNEFAHDAHNPLDTDILIIDEFSMVDVWLFSKLISASSKIKKILIVGDKDQLPSVGPGFVLKDLLESSKYPVITLDYNYRQAEGSEVIDLALNMNKGIFEIEDYHKDVKFFDSKRYPAVEVVLQLVQEALNRGYSIFDIQVLAPVYAGATGIDNLNFFLQKAFNPADETRKELKFGTRIFREQDKILQLKNQPDDFVFNGDIGVLVEITYDRKVIVDYEGNFVEYAISDLMNITHAYCLSVHKAQGSEYPIVVLLAENSYRFMLSRRLYYTAVTRSSKSLILLGDVSAFKKAVSNGQEDTRNTYLKERLK